MNYKALRRHNLKSIIIIIFLLTFAIVSTYLIYNKFIRLREQDYDTGKMEIVFHDKEGNYINMERFTPVTDAVGLSSQDYNFTVKNGTSEAVNYKIVLEDNNEKILEDGCMAEQIPKELLKVSFRKDHQAPEAYILSECPDTVLFEDTLEPYSEEEYAIRVWAVNTDFIVDRNSHFHGIIKVIEEGE